MEVHVYTKHVNDEYSRDMQAYFHQLDKMFLFEAKNVNILSLLLQGYHAMKDVFPELSTESSDLIQSINIEIAPYAMLHSATRHIPWMHNQSYIDFIKAFESIAFGDWKRLLIAEKFMCNFATHIGVISKREKKLVVKYLKVREDRICIFPPGIDMGRYSRKYNVTELKKRMNLQDKKIILFMSSFRYPPNIDALNIIRRLLIPSLVTIMGDKVTFLVLGQRRNSLNLGSKYFVDAGFVDDPVPYIQASDICIAPLRGLGQN